jgi:hypothetical protein
MNTTATKPVEQANQRREPIAFLHRAYETRDFNETMPYQAPRKPMDYRQAWYTPACTADACKQGDKPCPTPEACRLADRDGSTEHLRLAQGLLTAIAITASCVSLALFIAWLVG